MPATCCQDSSQLTVEMDNYLAVAQIHAGVNTLHTKTTIFWRDGLVKDLRILAVPTEEPI